MNWYLYINRESLQICKISPALEEDDETYVIQIDSELGISFIESPHLVNDYLVYYDGTKAHFIKKEIANDVIVPYFYTPLIIKDDVKNPDVLINVKKGFLEFVLKTELLGYTQHLYTTLDETRQTVEFYVCAKNDPNQLIDIIKVNMIQLVLTGSLTIPFDYDLSSVSLFTRKVFDSYGINNKLKENTNEIPDE